MTNFQTAQIFGDNMVLQFQKPVSVFGTGTDGTKITVSISGMEAATNSTVVHNGRWLVMLPPQPAQDSVELTVSRRLREPHVHKRGGRRGVARGRSEQHGAGATQLLHRKGQP